MIDLTGQKFGKLTVIERRENYITKNGTIKTTWLCRCECGKEIITKGAYLRAGDTRSCGCSRQLLIERLKDINKKYNTYDLTGEYGIGYTSKGEEFYFDLEDYDLIKDYCWSKNEYGYISTRLENRFIRMHRIIMNCPDDMEIDHIYHVNWDNRKEFLRIVTRSQNQMNVVLKSNNTSGITGVCWHSRDEKWQAYIQVNGDRIHLGSFDNFDEAVEVRKQAEEEYFGEYKYKNKSI